MPESRFDPRRLEEDFRALLQTVPRCTHTAALREAAAFFAPLSDRPDLALPFALELAAILPSLVPETPLIGLDPDPLRGLIFALTGAVDPGDEGQVRALDGLRAHVALLLAFCGDVAGSFEMLGMVRPSLRNPAFDPEAGPASPAVLFDQVLRLRDDREESARSGRDHLDWMLSGWRRFVEGGGNQVLVPVVEFDAIRNRPLGASLRAVWVDLYRSLPRGVDRLYADVALLASAEKDRAFEDAIASARAILQEVAPQSAAQAYEGRIGFDSPTSVHVGRSADLAIASAFVCATTRHNNLRVRLRHAKGLAMTAALAPSGAVERVDPDTLPLKVVAAFFSPVRTLVVARSQQDEVEQQVEGLQERFPRRKLEVLGVRHLQDAFFDRRVTELVRTPFVRFAARYLWNRRQRVGAIGIVAALLLTARLIHGPLDLNPVDGYFADEHLIVQNRFRQTVASLRVGRDRATESSQLSSLRHFLLEDVDGDGLHEVFYFATREDGVQVVRLEDLDRRGPHWEFPLRREIDYPESPEQPGSEFVPRNLVFGDLDADARSEIYVLAGHRNYFPAVVFKLDALTGEPLGDYLNSGMLHDAAARDLDGDGITELILGGGHQASGNAALIVLDPRFVDGAAPSTGRHAPAGERLGLEKWYVRFPSSPVGEISRYIERVRGVNSIVQLDSLFIVGYGDVAWVALRSLFGDSLSTAGARSPWTQERVDSLRRLVILPQDVSLIAHFNPDLSVRDVGTSSGFDGLAEFLVDYGYLPSVPARADWQEYARQFLYWSGTEWVRDQPVMNRHYVDTLRAWQTHRSTNRHEQ